MAIPPVALKRRNHRLLLCEDTRKPDLLALLIESHQDKHIAVVTSGDAAALAVPANVTVLSDDALPEKGAASFDLIISYDLPAAPQRYLERLALADDTALALLGDADRAHLLGIETLLGRAVSQERPEGFAPELPAAPKPKPKARRLPGEKGQAPREKRAEKAPFKKEAGTGQKRMPKASGVSRYIGTDENGKPMFSDKTGERNHRKDGRPHDEESLAAKREWNERRKSASGKKPYDRNSKPAHQDGERNEKTKKFDQKDDRPRRFENKPRSEEERGRKPREEREGKNEYRAKPAYGNKKPFKGDRKEADGKAPFKGNKKPFGGKRPSSAPAVKADDAGKPKRPPRRIKADKFKPNEPKE